MLEARLREEMKTYRKTLQKISCLKTKVLCALREEGLPRSGRNVADAGQKSRRGTVRHLSGMCDFCFNGTLPLMHRLRIRNQMYRAHLTLLFLEAAAGNLRGGVNGNGSIVPM